MQHVQKINPLSGQSVSLTPLHVTTIQPSRWERFSTRLKESGAIETITESTLATTTFLLVGGLLFAFYCALEQYTIIPLP